MTPKLAVLVEVEILAYKAFKLGLLMSGWWGWENFKVHRLTKNGKGYATTPKVAFLVEVEILAYKA
jgi:hypothetical protein